MSFRDNDRKLIIGEMPEDNWDDRACVEGHLAFNDAKKMQTPIMESEQVARINVAVDRALDGYIGASVRTQIFHLIKSHERLRTELGRLSAIEAQRIESKPPAIECNAMRIDKSDLKSKPGNS